MSRRGGSNRSLAEDRLPLGAPRGPTAAGVLLAFHLLSPPPISGATDRGEQKWVTLQTTWGSTRRSRADCLAGALLACRWLPGDLTDLVTGLVDNAIAPVPHEARSDRRLPMLSGWVIRWAPSGRHTWVGVMIWSGSSLARITTPG
jgi:hypothetical protein